MQLPSTATDALETDEYLSVHSDLAQEYQEAVGETLATIPTPVAAE